MTATMQVSRRPRYADYTDLGGPNTPGEDYWILVDDQVIGSTYWCSAGDVPAGQRWASWGPAGLSLRHPDRESAERTQIRAYAANPDITDRAIAEDARAAEQQHAEGTAAKAERAEQHRRDRLGDDEPGPTLWVLPSHHFLFAPEPDVVAVAGWLEAHDLLGQVSGVHEIRVEQRTTRQVIIFERPSFAFARRAGQTETWAVTCTVVPPPVDTTARPDLIELLGEHYPTKFPLIDFGSEYACATCTRAFTSPTAVTPWPCAPFIAARDADGGEGR